MARRPDRIDLRIAEVEARVVTKIRRLIAQESLEHCRTNHPYCPYLKSTKLCSNIQETLEEETPIILQEMSEKN